MGKKALFTVAVFLALAGVAAAKPELNTGVLRVLLGDDVVCIVSNAGTKDVTIELEMYGDGAFHGSTGEQVLQPNENYSLGTTGHFYWRCKIIVVKGNAQHVRAVLYGIPEGESRGALVLEAR
jgi:hypothetical protein